MDIDDWFTPQSNDDDDPDCRVGTIYFDGRDYTPDQVEAFAAELVTLAATARQNLATLDYANRVEQIANTYDTRIMALLETIRQNIGSIGGYESVEPYTMHDDNYRWAFATKNAEGHVAEGSIDVMVELVESRDCDGEDAPAGLNWTLRLTKFGGETIGGIEPYNFTPAVWVPLDNDRQIEDRFKLIEEWVEVDQGHMVHVIDGALAEENPEPGTPVTFSVESPIDAFRQH